MAKKSAKSNLKQNALAISVAIILALFIGYGIETFYESPKYDDFCGKRFIDETNKTQVAQQERCTEEYEEAREPYNRNVFIITLILGLVAIIVGGVFLKLESVSTGIMGGGILTIFYGTLVFWGNMSKYIRFVILAIALVILISIGYKKLKR